MSMTESDAVALVATLGFDVEPDVEHEPGVGSWVHLEDPRGAGLPVSLLVAGGTDVVLHLGMHTGGEVATAELRTVLEELLGSPSTERWGRAGSTVVVDTGRRFTSTRGLLGGLIGDRRRPGARHHAPYRRIFTDR
ncbi:MAG TPA: hypothetical protein VGE77_12900 [Nocardioides sp.]